MVYSKCPLFVFELLFNLFNCGHLLGKSCPLAFSLVLFYFSAVLIVGVPFPYGVQDRMWNPIVSAPDHCLFI